jgi:hypothetical protein
VFREVNVIEICLAITVELYNLFVQMQCKMINEWHFL